MENNFIVCPTCKKNVPTNSNYCYLCGEALSNLANENEYVKLQNAKLMVLNQVLNVLTDEADINMVKGIVYKIKNN